MSHQISARSKSGGPYSNQTIYNLSPLISRPTKIHTSLIFHGKFTPIRIWQKVYAHVIRKRKLQHIQKYTYTQAKRKDPKNINFTSMSRRTLCYAAAKHHPHQARPLLFGRHTPTRGHPTFIAANPPFNANVVKTRAIVVENAPITNICHMMKNMSQYKILQPVG